MRPANDFFCFYQEELGKKLVEKDLPTILGFLENLLKENGCTGFFIGKEVSNTHHTVT
jgi:hypothetical protein